MMLNGALVATPDFLPYKFDLFDDRVPYQDAYKRVYERIVNLGRLTTELLERCVAEDEQLQLQSQQPAFMRTTFVATDPRVIGLLERLRAEWLEQYLTMYETMNETQTISVDDADGGRKRTVRFTMGSSVFTELARIHYLLRRPLAINTEDDDGDIVSLHNTRHPSWVAISRSFQVQYDDDKEDRDDEAESALAQVRALWERPVARYTQSDVMLVAIFLTQQLSDLRADCVAEFRAVYEAVLLRASELMQEAHPADVLNASLIATHGPPVKVEFLRTLAVAVQPPEVARPLYVASRDFACFCAFYLGEIMRRFYYYDLFVRKPPAVDLAADAIAMLATRVRAWVERIVDGLAEEAFLDMHTDNANEAYAFAGDDRWFRFRWPLKVHSRGAVLGQLRPHLYKRFHSEAQASRRLLMGAPETHLTRTFILQAVSQYITTTTGRDIQWHRAVVVHSEEIYRAGYSLEQNPCPLILQVLSSYWAYNYNRVYMTDDIYTTIAAWFVLLRERYDSCLLGHDLRGIVDEAIGVAVVPQQQQQPQAVVPAVVSGRVLSGLRL
jgi:hypothetical protein